MSSEQGFDDLYYGSYRSVLRTVVLLSRDVETAHDHVQEAFARAWRRWSTVSRLDDPQAWVRRVAVNAAIDAGRREESRRRAHRLLRVVARHQPAPDVVSVDVARALAVLKPAHRQAVVLHYLADMTIKDIAKELGMPEGTVKTNLARGRAALATLLAVSDEEVAVDA